MPLWSAIEKVVLSLREVFSRITCTSKCCMSSPRVNFERTDVVLVVRHSLEVVPVIKRVNAGRLIKSHDIVVSASDN
jgi:hypothetical protein